MTLDSKKCKHCGYRMSKLYRHQNKKPFSIPIVWYCKECDKLGDRIRTI